MKTILITGINGFLGSNLAKRLSAKFNIIGTEVSLENLNRIKNEKYRVYPADLESTKQIFLENKIEIIIHTATFYGKNNEQIKDLFNSNLHSPFNLLDLGIANQVKLFINTDSALERFTNAYSLTKKQFVDWLKFRSSEIKVANMQLEHFYGPGASNTNFITSMIKKLVKNEPKINLTAGEQKRDFIYYDDIVDAYEIIINSFNDLENRINNFEVGSGELISIKELMLLLKKLTNSSSKLNFGAIPYRENELMESKSDLHSVYNLGWRPKTNLQDGLLKTINEIKE